MQIERISIVNEGYVYCNSDFYSSADLLSANLKYDFYTGVNKLTGEIDSGIWAVSYLLSMYQCRSKDFVLFNQAEVTVNDTLISLDDLLQYSCYMDRLYPLFSTKTSIKNLISKGLCHFKSQHSPDEIKDLFHLSSDRFERPLSNVGNEVFNAMAAIGYCYEKQVFCFPWLSKMRFDYYHYRMSKLLDILERMQKIIILPIGQ